VTVAKHYFECHITIDPVFAERRQLAGVLAGRRAFRLAKLFMAKDMPSTEDTFMTAADKVYELLVVRMTALVNELQANAFTVRRYKIEDIVLDSRIDDVLKLLPEARQQ
jgi:hypothetical protein